MSEHTRLFDLADRLKELRDEKKALEQQLKELSARLDETDEALAGAMLETETQNFTRSGVMFCLTNTTRASAAAERKSELGSLYRVRVGPFADVESMNRARARLSDNGVDVAVVRVPK